MKWSPIIPFKAFAPTADQTTEGALLEIVNVIPCERGWRTAYGLGETGMESLTATCVGAALCQLTNGTFSLVAGSGERLYLRSGVAWADISESATAYTATSDQRWSFAVLGDYILAGTASDTIQVSNAGATFSAIAGAPKARMIEAVNGFVMAAGTSEATYNEQPDRWWSSALFDHTDWTPALATQCTTGRLVDTPGPIRALKRFGSGIVAYKDNSMYLGQYVQPPIVWQWLLVSSDVGCASNDAVINIGTGHLFVGPNNFYLYDGAQVTPIGDDIRQWFFDQQLLRAYDGRIQAVHDAAKRLVYWFYPSTAGSGELDAAIVYDYRSNRWGCATYAVESGVDYVGASITYNGLGNIYTTYNAGIDRTYDSPLWIPDKVVPSVIANDHVLKTIDDNGSGGSITTWHIGDDQAMTLLRRVRVRWLTAPTAATVSLETINNHGGTLQPRATAVETDNKFDLLACARWHRMKIDITGDAEFAGIQVDLEPQGMW